MLPPHKNTFEHVWDNHLANLSQLFDALYSKNALLDVTLSCQGGFLRAHKLVLSACSPYFARVFQENPCKHPTIILTTVSHDDMSKLVEFMYKGRVNLPSERVKAILQVAGDLQVKGFEDFYAKQKGKEAPKQANKSVVSKEAEKIEGSTLLTIPTLNKLPRIDLEEVVKNSTKRPHIDNSEEDSDCGNEIKIYTCEVCNGAFKSRKVMLKHKKIHQDKTFSCEFCDKLFSRASHLIRHRRVHTGERPFICNVCGKDFARQDKLKLHLRTSHAEVVFDNSSKTSMDILSMRTRSVLNEDHEEEDLSNDHVTLGDFEEESINANEEKKSGSRGRPRKSIPLLKMRRGRGRPRKDASSGANYDMSDLPYGDINYLTMPCDSSPIEPIIEINTDTNDASNKKTDEMECCDQLPRDDETTAENGKPNNGGRRDTKIKEEVTETILNYS